MTATIGKSSLFIFITQYYFYNPICNAFTLFTMFGLFISFVSSLFLHILAGWDLVFDEVKPFLTLGAIYKLSIVVMYNTLNSLQFHQNDEQP